VTHAAPYDAAVVAGAQAACKAPHGPVDPFTTVAEVRERLVGSWYFCSSTGGNDNVTSIEFTPDDHWYYLEPDGNGGLQRGQGVDYEGTYTISPANSGWVDGAPDAGSDGFVGRMLGASGIPDFMQFETGPRRMQIEVGTAGFEEWFVYIGPSDPT
jgi:hypothetical protein